jgi:hypothetical protein
MNKNTYNDLAFFEMMLCAMSGESPSVAIENQEKRGQLAVVRNQRLPKKANSHTVPRDIFFKGVENKMSYEEREKITTANIIEYTRAKYERMGIEIAEDYDDLFWSVKLPDGWEIRATDHTMWNELVDNKGRKRATFFYKAAFYDRDAFSNFETRFHVSVDHVADPESDYEIWEASDYQGTVKDGDVIICSTARVTPTGDYLKDEEVKKPLYEQLEMFMKEHYPDYENTEAYWD